jgi:hypothetical protein
MWKLMNLSRNKMHVVVAEFKTFGNYVCVNSIKGSRFPKPMTGIDHESWGP